jgi:hypothetical protein
MYEFKPYFFWFYKSGLIKRINFFPCRSKCLVNIVLTLYTIVHGWKWNSEFYIKKKHFEGSNLLIGNFF